MRWSGFLGWGCAGSVFGSEDGGLGAFPGGLDVDSSKVSPWDEAVSRSKESSKLSSGSFFIFVNMV
jgi:hypothetical protein